MCRDLSVSKMWPGLLSKTSLLAILFVGCTLSPKIVAQDAPSPNVLRGHETLTAGESYCIPVTVHPSRAVNLGAGQLTITFSSQSESHEDIVLESRITKPQITLLKGTSRLTLCGVVPQLGEKQTGQYFASDFATHFGSGNVTNIGTPDDGLVDTEGLAKQLQSLHPTFKR